MELFNQITLEAIKLVLAGIIGGLIGARANDRLTRRREKDAGMANRKREFLAFMAQLLAEAQRPYPTGHFVDFYLNKSPNLRHAATLISEDIPIEKRRKFNALID